MAHHLESPHSDLDRLTGSRSGAIQRNINSGISLNRVGGRCDKHQHEQQTEDSVNLREPETVAVFLSAHAFLIIRSRLSKFSIR